jgi:hypothetical protein
MPFDNPNQDRVGEVELLWDARSLICDQSNWVQGRYSDGDRLCLVAALSVTAGSLDFQAPNRTERRLARLLAARLPEKAPIWARLRLFPARQRLILFNDCPQTTHGDVLALFDRAIDHAVGRTHMCVPV